MDTGVQRPGRGATGRESHCREDGVTHRILDSSEVQVGLLEPVVEVLGVVRGVPLTIGGHAEHGQGVLDVRQAAQVGLGTQEQGPGPTTLTEPRQVCA